MDVIQLLSSLKGKALDVHHIELLRHAYALQEQNIEQLKTNNDALRQSIDLLREQLSELRSREMTARQQTADLAAELDRLTKRVIEDEKVPVASTKEDCLARLRGWMGNRTTGANGSTIHFVEVDRELRLPEGSTREYIEEAASNFGYRAEYKGQHSILFT